MTIRPGGSWKPKSLAYPDPMFALASAMARRAAHRVRRAVHLSDFRRLGEGTDGDVIDRFQRLVHAVLEPLA